MICTATVSTILPICLPALNETVYAVRGEGCYWNGRRAHVSQVAQLKDAMLLASGLDAFGNKTAAWQQLCHGTSIQRTWGDAYGYTLVATGRAEIMLDPVAALWDCAPLQVILEEAGGTFTDWRGHPTIHAGEGVATNGLLLEPVLRTLASA